MIAELNPEALARGRRPYEQVCTWNGDVWLVSGIDDTLELLTWQRIATGLFQVGNWHGPVTGTGDIGR